MTASALLEVRGLEVAYGTGRRRTAAVRGVDLTVQPGETLALVGESGSGKSTVSQAIVRQLPVGGAVTGGTVRFGGQNLGALRASQLRRLRGARIGYVPQDPHASLNPLLTIGEQVVEVLTLHRGLSRPDAWREAVRILGDVGLSSPEARARQYPHQLSGGMKQRVLIGIALSCDPALVIADEPTSALDVTVQKRVLDQIDELSARHGTAVLFVTHDLGVAADRADSIVVMRRGLVVEHGPVERVLGAPEQDYTRELVAAAPGLTAERLRPSTASPTAEPAVPVSPRETDDASSALLVLSGIRKTYPLRTPGEPTSTLVAVDDVSLAVPRGQTVSLVGESGSGKTTTARIAARIIAADAGSVLFDGRDVTSLRGESLRQLRRDLQVVYQNPFGSLDPRFTVERLIAEPLRVFGVGDRAERRRTVRDLLDAVQLPAEAAARRAVQLSGGQRQRVAIARALALRPKLVVLDEPVSALDVSVQERILQLLVDLQAELGLSYLFITHDLGVVRQVSDRVVVMQHARVVEHGDAAAVLRAPRERYTQELVAAIPGTSRPHTGA